MGVRVSKVESTEIALTALAFFGFGAATFIAGAMAAGLLGTGKAAEWLGGIGSVAAAAAAVGIALRDGRRRARDDYDRATITAARITPTLTYAVQRLSFICVSLDFRDETVELTDVVRNLEQIETMGAMRTAAEEPVFRLSDEQLLHLAPLPRHAGIRIARALGLIDQVRKETSANLRRGPRHGGKVSAEQRSADIRRWHDALSEAARYLQAALEVCKEATSAVPYPTAQEIYGD